MYNLNQFIIYKLVWNEELGKFDKKPQHPNLYNHNPHDPSIWMSYEDAKAYADTLSDEYGVGFTFTKNDPYWFLDIDGALVDGEWNDVSKELCNKLAGCAVEVSVSGKGLHVVGAGTVPEHGCTNKKLGLEFYTDNRFMALGHGFSGDFNKDATNDITEVVQKYFQSNIEKGDKVDVEWTDDSIDGYLVTGTDDDLIKYAMMKYSNHSPNFKDLWENESLGDSWVKEDGKTMNGNQADFCLACWLGEVTGFNCERTKTLMWKSGLVRDKWTTNKGYIKRTIKNAFSDCLSKKPKSVKAKDVVDSVEIVQPTLRAADTMMNASEQLEFFKGCIYVRDRNEVLMPKGVFYKKDTFNNSVKNHNFIKNADSETQTEPWKALTGSLVCDFPQAESTCFRPDLPFQAFVGDKVNTYVPIDKSGWVEGDVTLFIEHMKMQLSNDRDREILLSYLAAIVQYPGKKFYWCPVIQGVQGNGKSFYSTLLKYCVGDKYYYGIRSSDLENKFNAWMEGKIVLAIEDMFVPRGKLEVMEILKPMITGKEFEIQGKGRDQYMAEVCGNFIINTNSKDALIKERSDRRYAIFYTDQQTEEDVVKGDVAKKCGKLYDWVHDGGFGHIAHFLQNYEIKAEFNPAENCIRAPETSSTQEAISNSLGPIATTIKELIDECNYGLCGGFVSMAHLDYHNGKKFPRRGITEIMKELGYIPHPVLSDGRVTRKIHIHDSVEVKTRLYVIKNHLSVNFKTGEEVVSAFESAQAELLLSDRNISKSQ